MSYSYNHDAEVIVYNYKNRDPDLLVGPLSAASFDVSETEEIKIGHAITGITCTKSKSSPYGSFSITLKPTSEWTKIIVPGSWCAIFMSNTSIDQTRLNNKAIKVGDNYACPLKMVGLIMAIRVSKGISQDGAVTTTYTLNGYDFGYLFTSSIYVNQLFQAQVLAGKYDAVWSNLTFPDNDSAIGDPVLNINRVLNAWSEISSSGISVGASIDVKPPSTRIVVPGDVAKLLGTKKEVIGFILTAIGLDNRKGEKVIPIKGGSAENFEPELIGQKYFEPRRLIINNTLWGMINEYMNPTLNEAYCDLHVCKAEDISSLSSLGSFASIASGAAAGSQVVQPIFVMRQIPFSTPQYKQIVPAAAIQVVPSPPGNLYPVTLLTDLPKTIIPAHKVIQYDVGFSEYERVNFTELNAFDINVQQKSFGSIQTDSKPTWEDGAIKRFGLRPKVVYGADYGFSATDKLNTANKWRGLIRDWFFNNHRYVNGTVECIGLDEHIAIGENLVLEKENLLAHIESYTHTFTVDNESGSKIFRTSIEFTKGLSAKSNSLMFTTVYGSVLASVAPEPSIFEDDMQRNTFHPSKPK